MKDVQTRSCEQPNTVVYSELSHFYFSLQAGLASRGGGGQRSQMGPAWKVLWLRNVLERRAVLRCANGKSPICERGWVGGGALEITLSMEARHMAGLLQAINEHVGKWNWNCHQHIKNPSRFFRTSSGSALAYHQHPRLTALWLRGLQ